MKDEKARKKNKKKPWYIFLLWYILDAPITLIWGPVTQKEKT
jgi:hypothetical protein